jgi:hypothetical protein
MSSPSPSPRRLAATAAAALCAAFAAHAEEFSWQLSGGASESEASSSDSDSWAVDATFYVKSIDDGDGPYALASFLNPTTRVSAEASKSDSPAPGDGPTAYVLAGAYVLPGEKWYLGASYAKSDADDTLGVTVSDPKGYGVRAGRYLGANTTLELGLGRSEQKSSISCLGPPFCTAGAIELTTDSVHLEVFHVRRFRSLTYALQGSVSDRDTDVDISSPLLSFLPPGTSGPGIRTYSVAAEFFPTRTLGVRVGYSRPDGDFDYDSYNLGATWYFKPQVAVQFAFSASKVDDAPAGLGRSEGTALRFIGRL